MVRSFLETLNWPLLIIAAFTLGLSPFAPPHLLDKLMLLKAGQLINPMDWFDFLLHGTQWFLIISNAVV
jgi:hypothetical protein